MTSKERTLIFTAGADQRVLIVAAGSVEISNAGNESGSALLKLDGVPVDQRHVANLGSEFVALPFTLLYEGVPGHGQHTVEITTDISGDEGVVAPTIVVKF